MAGRVDDVGRGSKCVVVERDIGNRVDVEEFVKLHAFAGVRDVTKCRLLFLVTAALI